MHIYTKEFFNSYCEENNIILQKNYSNESINAKTIVIAKCLTNGCNQNFTKFFDYMVKSNSCYCKICTNLKKREKIKKTCLEKYGVDNPLKSNIIKDKCKKIFLEKYGVDNPTKLNTIKDKIKNKCLEKYGVENVFQLESIKETIKKTNISKLGVEHPSKSKECIQKKEKNFLEKHGVKNPSQLEEIKNKKKETCLKNFGVEYNFQSNVVKENIKKTNIKKYGVEYPIQNIEIAEKSSKNAYKLKDYKLPSGKIIKIQGYECYALDELLKSNDENDIETGYKNVPNIKYIGENGNEHTHYPDIYISNKNLIVEVKSTWTLKKKYDNVFLKQNAAKFMGFNYKIWVYNDKGEKVQSFD